MRDTYIDRELCIFLVRMLKSVTISFVNSDLTLFGGAALKFIIIVYLWSHSFDKQGCDLTLC